MKSTPNTLVICSDQHHPHMSGYRNHPIVKTPVLDKLAAGGTHFTRAYCNSPVCTPARMSFITGKYVHQIDSWMIGIPLDPKEMTWARRLDQAGIPSTMLGKMDFCGEYQDGGFTDHKILKKRGAFASVPMKNPYPARMLGYTRPGKRRLLVEAGSWTDETIGASYKIGEERDGVGLYDHDRTVTDWSIEYLRQKGKEKSGKPWALYVGLLFPHWAFRVPEKYYTMYYPDNIEMPVEALFPNENLHPALKYFQDSMVLGEVTEDMLRRTIAAYYGMITCMDDMIGEILQVLKEEGFGENTNIIYTTDHGESLGDHGLFYKQCSYEGSAGVPLILNGPSVPSGEKVDHPVTLVDMYPTIMEMNGLETESDRPGKSWLPLARGEKNAGLPYAFAEFHGNFTRHGWYMLVEGDYKYTYYVKERPTLYNLKDDPRELKDLAGDPQYASMLDKFEKTLRSILDPEETALRAKRDLGLIGENGEDFTETLNARDLGPPKPGFWVEVK